jgi:RNA polymerase sigma-70 factor (ECF subfamily)
MPADNVTSFSLLQRVSVRDALAWQRLVALYRPLVVYWCRRAGVRPDDADDLVQEVFLAVANGLGQFDHRGPGSFRGWLRGVTRHKVLDLHERRGRQPAAAAGGTDITLDRPALERIDRLAPVGLATGQTLVS